MGESLRQLVRISIAEAARLTGVTAVRRRRRGIVIFMLHKVNDESDALQLTLRPELLEAIVQEVSGYGECISFSAINREMLQDSETRFCFTFDDGYEDNYSNALPVLENYSVPATIFIPTGFIDGRISFWYEKLGHFLKVGRGSNLDLRDYGFPLYEAPANGDWQSLLLELNDGLKSLSSETRNAAVAEVGRQLNVEEEFHGSPMLDWDQVHEMSERQVSFGSHTVTHPILARESSNVVRNELRQSKQRIEKKIGRAVDTLAYPNGTEADFDDETIAEAIAAGYRLACTTVQGLNDEDTPLMMLRRMHVHNAMCTGANGEFSPAVFWAKVLQIL